MHAWCALCVFLCNGKFLLEAVGILILCNYSSNLDRILFSYARMVCTVCFFFVMENSCLRQLEFRACSNNVRQTCCALSVFLHDENFLVKAVGFQSLCLSIFLENVTGNCSVMHAWCTLCVFFCDGKFLLEAGGILSLSNYSWTYGLQIVCQARKVCTTKTIWSRQFEF